MLHRVLGAVISFCSSVSLEVNMTLSILQEKMLDQGEPLGNWVFEEVIQIPVMSSFCPQGIYCHVREKRRA